MIGEINNKIGIINSGFTLNEILDYNSDRCYMTILGKLTQNDELFVLKIKKKEYNTDNLDDIRKGLMKLTKDALQTFNNDIYYKYLADDISENKVFILFNLV